MIARRDEDSQRSPCFLEQALLDHAPGRFSLELADVTEPLGVQSALRAEPSKES